MHAVRLKQVDSQRARIACLVNSDTPQLGLLEQLIGRLVAVEPKDLFLDSWGVIAI